MFVVTMKFFGASKELIVAAETKEAAKDYISKQMEGREYNGLGIYVIEEIPLYASEPAGVIESKINALNRMEGK